MFTLEKFSLRQRPLLFLVQFLALSQPLCALAAFQNDFEQESIPRRFAFANVESWEEYKKIRQAGGSIADTAAHGKEFGVAMGGKSTKEEVTAEQDEQVAPKSLAPSALQAAPFPKATPTPKATPAPKSTTASKTKSIPSPPAGPTPQANANIHRPALGKPAPHQITAPTRPTEQGEWWAYYVGKMNIHANPYYDPHGIDFQWAYSRKNPLPKEPRIVVDMHGSGGGEGSMRPFGPADEGDIEVRNQDAETYGQYHQPAAEWREWWTFGADGLPYPGRRIVATLDFLVKRYQIDVSKKGLILRGASMGGAGAVIQTMILPDPWRERIAYSWASGGVIMPRRIAQRDPGQYITLPPDNPSNRALWDSIDFSIQAAVDPIVRGMHYRHAFSSDDPFSEGPDGNTQLEFVNLVEKYKIGGAFTWVQVGHGAAEEGVAFPDITQFESPEQDVTLDRAHPAITNSTGNFPLSAADRTNEAKYPRGHYNMGITWNHANIVDEASQIIFPLKYNRRTGIGKGVPDQPLKITVSVTPRRPRDFILNDGETLKWSWDGGALAGVATVTGDTVTVHAIPLVSGGDYKTLRIYR